MQVLTDFSQALRDYFRKEKRFDHIVVGIAVDRTSGDITDQLTDYATQGPAGLGLITLLRAQLDQAEADIIEKMRQRASVARVERSLRDSLESSGLAAVARDAQRPPVPDSSTPTESTPAPPDPAARGELTRHIIRALRGLPRGQSPAGGTL